MLRGMSRLTRKGVAVTGCWLVVAVAGAIVPATPALPAESPATAVTIRLGDVLEKRFLGLGVDFAPYPLDLDEDAWRRNFARLDQMRPGLIRVMITDHVYTDGYRADGTPNYRWDKPKMLQLRRILDWAKLRDVTVVLGEWTLPQPGAPGATGWANRIATFVGRVHADGYTNVRYYNLINEPDRNSYTETCAAGTTTPPVWKARWRCWRDAVTTLRTALNADPRTRGVGLVGPDTTEWLEVAPRRRSAVPRRPARPTVNRA